MPTSSSDSSETKILRRVATWLCFGTLVVSILSCVILAVVRSEGLTQVTITAIDPDAEPRDHNIPLFRKNEALPDYQVIVKTTSGRRVDLGAKINESAAGGLTWQLPQPVSTADVSVIRLVDQDQVIADALAEVQLTGKSFTSGNYRFDVVTKRSYAVGLESFFGTPIGKAIAAAFLIAVLVMIFAAWAAITGSG